MTLVSSNAFTVSSRPKAFCGSITDKCGLPYLFLMFITFSDITDVTAFKSLSVGGNTVPIWAISVRLSSLTQFSRSHVYDISDQPRFDEWRK